MGILSALKIRARLLACGELFEFPLWGRSNSGVPTQACVRWHKSYIDHTRSNIPGITRSSPVRLAGPRQVTFDLSS